MNNAQKQIILLIGLIIIAVGAWLYLFFASPAKEDLKEIIPKKAELTEIKIADSAPLLTFIAIEKGFFKEEGLQVKSEKMLPENGVSALLAGEVDYATFLGIYSGPAIEIGLRNAPIKTIMLTARYKESYVVTRPELEINDLKTIGILFQGILFQLPLYYQGLKFIEENDLETEIITVETRQELQDLLQIGKADAILTAWGRAVRFQTQGFPILDIIVDELPSYLTARNDKIEKNPEEVQKMIRTLEKTMEFIVTEPEETKRLLLRYWELKETKENLVMVEDYYPIIKTAYNRRGVPYDKGAKLLIQIAKAGEFETLQEVEEQVVTQEELDKVFDFRFVK